MAEVEKEAVGRVVMGQEKMSPGSHGDSSSINNQNNCHHNGNQEDAQVSGTTSAASSTSSSSSDKSNTNMNKGKSCKGSLYYSSTIKSNSRNPLCVGITRSLPHVPRYIVSETEMETSKEGRTLTEFKYGCIGYSIYADQKDGAGDVKERPAELPVCVGLEILVDRRAANADSTPAHVHNKEDGTGIPQPRPRKPAHSVGDEFLTRFTRNANLVAMGVVKNVRKVGNRIKESVDDILYPYRRRPK